MSHPAVDPASVARLQDRLGRADPTVTGGAGGAAPASGASAGSAVAAASGAAAAKAKAKAAARRAARPVVVRLRHELDRAVARELGSLRAEVADLRRELTRTRAEHGAAIAALQEELDAR